ncbi:unnamed protein product [Pseudo-nitzschia multistriata]|uniref:NmrA-like domain-containing protein n=1 Tax=Pseudo-nitzschia multistriata TaxID=183589 RepID=A0A448ZIC8_9STRA|nr:unnamed protein product [Pseudo-nitzschia multistriata]
MNKNRSLPLFLSTATAYAFGFLLWMTATTIKECGGTVLALALATPPTTIPVAVLGATGRLGKETVGALLERGIPVRALVRPSSVEKLKQQQNQNELPGDGIGILDHPQVEIIEGELLDTPASGTYSDDTVLPSEELVECLTGCSVCIACYGATRKTKPSELLSWVLSTKSNDDEPDPSEDTDPIHPKQINYRSMLALGKACERINSSNNNNKDTTRIEHIVRITGKGEDPTGIFSVLLNGLGSFCKLWNYQGETVLRSKAFGGPNSGTNENEGSVGYTIVRPGVMVEDLKEDDLKPGQRRYLELKGNGGNDLPVTPVTRPQIAGLLAELAVGEAAGAGRRRRVTLAAMNVVAEDEAGASGSDLRDRIRGLASDSRSFPDSLVHEHKSATKRFFRRLAAAVAAVVVAAVSLLGKVVLG